MTYRSTSESAVSVPRSAFILGAALAAFSFTSSASAQSSVVLPSDPIQIVNGTNDGDGDAGAPPSGEVVSHAIDGVGQKYLNFLDLNSGFAVSPSAGPTVITGLKFYAANDAVERDPASYLLEGSTGSFDGVFVTISSGALSLPGTRNDGGNAALNDAASQTVTFANTTAYSTYRLTFPTLKDAAGANSMQIAEVQFLGTVVPEPGTMALAGLAAGLGLVIRRNRRNA